MPFWMGDDERAAELFGQSLEIGRRLGRSAADLAGARVVSLASRCAPTWPRAGGSPREALAVSEAAADEPGRSNALHLLGVGAQIAGDLPEARDWMTQRLALVRAMGNEFLVASEASQPQHGRAPAREPRRRRGAGARGPGDRPSASATSSPSRSPSAGSRPSPRSAASSSARRPSSARPRRSWRPSTWPGRRTNDRTTSGCWRRCPRRWARTSSSGRAARGRSMAGERGRRVRSVGRRATSARRRTAGRNGSPCYTPAPVACFAAASKRPARSFGCST